jgi:hypothetical protein
MRGSMRVQGVQGHLCECACPDYLLFKGFDKPNGEGYTGR